MLSLTIKRVIKLSIKSKNFCLKPRYITMGNVESNLDTKYINTNCRIVVVGPKSGDTSLLELAKLPKDARILATGTNLEEIRKDGELFSEANVLLNVSGNAKILGEIINEMPFLVWIHSITAGVDHILCPEIKDNNDIVLTNAKGVYSSSLAEWAMTACSYFAKDLPRMLQQKNDRNWNQFCVTELRGKTMGIVGYGNIGIACAKLAKAYGMKVNALRRNPKYCDNDRYVDQAFGMDQLDTIMAQSDYLVVCLPLTSETHHFIKESNLKNAKKGMIFINIGRGALVDEEALIRCLKDNTIVGAALDVFTVEPLPKTSELWGLPNVLISPHNCDLLIDSRSNSVKFFTENCSKFLAGEDLDAIVDKTAGY